MLASADDGDTFSEETVEGALLKYTIISESEKTCMVGETYYPDVPGARVRRGPEDEVCQASGDITIPEEANGYRVVRVESFAFNRAAITSVFIPNSVKTIGNSAFTECADLKSVRLSEQLTRIEAFTFCSCESLTNIDIPEGVTSIGDYAFANCKQLKEITIPSCVEHFGEDVFCNTGFTSLPKLPESLTVIPKSMFYECTQLTSIEIPENITWIGDCAFGRCPMAEIDIPASVTRIGVAAFANCKNITDLTIPNNVTEIGMNAFCGCSNLKTVTLSNNISGIREGSFKECTSLESVIIPNGLKFIGKWAFLDCSSLRSIDIPETVEEIGEKAFANCSSLTQLFIPKSVVIFKINKDDNYWQYSYRSCISGCTNLTSLVVDEDNPVYDSRNNCNAIIETASNTLVAGCITTKIPEGITTIGLHAFDGFQNLTSITLPHSLNGIENGAFNMSGLHEIKIPENVTSIGAYAFSNCANLKGFSCYAENVPEAESNIFYNTNIKDIILYVPAASVSAYQATEPWKDFKEIVELTNNPNTPKYFPTGMTWEEIVVNPDMELEDNNACIYEIGTDTIIGDVTYKKVLRNNVFSGLCVRESGDKVWLLAKEYPTEILLYNFDWDSNQEIVTEYLKGQDEEDDDYKVCQETTPVGDSQTVEIEGKSYQYIIKRLSGTVIRGIGKVAELNRYPCLLSYREPAEILPGLDYLKVHWIKRNGVEIFRSESAKEWTEEIRDVYRPFIEEGKVWKVGSTAGISDGIAKMVDYYYFDGDTIINGNTCKQMMCQRYVSPNHPDYAAMSQIPSLRYVGAWYEEGKKVYIYDTTNKQFRMTYDFSLEANDILFIDNQPYVIGPKQTGGLEGFKGVYRDIMWCFGGDPYYNYNTTWLEGVGGIDGPTVNVYSGEVGHGLFLMSCVVGDEVIYLNDEYEDGATPEEARKKRFDFTHTIKIQPKARIRKGEEQLLYGEYNDQQLGIHLDLLNDAYLVSITDESGKVVYEKAVNAGSIVGLSIDISAYVEGRYTVTVENSQESFTGVFETQTGIDVNGDGKVNGTDIQTVINVIVNEEYSEKADVNKDNKVNGTDIQEIINIIVNE
jgi:hypothetical protein